ncbi:hypothetical protein ACJX0J_018949, partial [Zea mays]
RLVYVSDNLELLSDSLLLMGLGLGWSAIFIMNFISHFVSRSETPGLVKEYKGLPF